MLKRGQSVAACVCTTLAQPNAEAAYKQLEKVASALEERLPCVASVLRTSQDDALAYMGFPSSLWRPLHSATRSSE